VVADVVNLTQLPNGQEVPPTLHLTSLVKQTAFSVPSQLATHLPLVHLVEADAQEPSALEDE